MPTTIEQLELEVQSSSTSAVAGIDALSTSLSKLKNAIRGGVGLTSVVNQVRNLDTALQSVDGSSADKIDKLANSFGKLSTLGKVKISSSIGNQLKNISSAASALNTTDFDGLSKLGNVLHSFSNLGKINLSTFTNNLPKLAQAMNSLNVEELEAKMRGLSNSLAPVATSLNLLNTSFRGLPANMSSLISATNASTGANNKNTLSWANIAAKVTAAYLILKRATLTVASWINESNSYIENLNLFNASMGEYAKEAQNYAEKVSEIMGIDPGEWMRNQGVFNTIISGFGVASDKAYLMSKNLTQLGYDISSFSNISFEDAMQKLQSGISGELEPLRRLGYDLSVARLQQEALNLGIEKSVNDMTQAEKSQLRYYAIMTQVTVAQGDMARTLNAPANQMRVLKAQVTQCARALGNIFIPALSAVLPYAIAFVKVIRMVADAIASFFNFKLPEVKMPDISAGASAMGELADNADNATSGLGNAGKAAKKLKNALLGIDELNVLSKDDSSSGGGSGSGSSAGIGGGDLGIDLPTYDFLDDAVTSKVDEIIQKMKEWLGLTDEINSWGDFFHTRLGRILTTVGAIGLGFAAWKIGKGVLAALRYINDLKGMGLGSPLNIVVGISLLVTGIALEWSGIVDAIMYELNSMNFGQIVSGGLLTVAGGAFLGKGIAAWIAKAFSGSAVASALNAAMKNLGLNSVSAAGAALGAGVAAIIAGLPMYFTGIWDAIKNGLNWLNGILIPTGSTMAAAGIGAIIGACGGPLTAGIGALIGLAVGLVTDGIIAIAQNFDSISQWVNQTGEKIKKGFSDTVEAVKGFIGKFANAFASVLGELTRVGSNIWKGITEWIGGLIKSVCDALGIQSPSTVFKGIGEDIVAGLLNGIEGFTNMVNTVKQWSASVVEWFTKGNDGKNIIDHFKEIGGNIVDGFKDKISDTYTGVESRITTWAGAVKDWFTSGSYGGVNFSTFSTFANNTIEGFKNKIGTSYTNSKENLTTWASKAKEWFTSSSFGGVNANTFSTFANDTIEGFKNKIGSAYTNTKSNITTWASKAKEWFTSGSFGGVNTTTFSNYANDTIEGFKNKIGNGYTNTKSNITTWATNVKSWFSNIASSSAFSDFAINVIDGFKNKIATSYTSAANPMTAFASSVKNWFENPDGETLVSKFKTIGVNIIQGFINGVSSLWNSAMSKIKEFGRSIIHSGEEGTEEHSPSKAFKRIGAFVIEGFNIGIESMVGDSFKIMDNWLTGINGYTPQLAFAVDTTSLDNFNPRNMAYTIGAEVQSNYNNTVMTDNSSMRKVMKEAMLEALNTSDMAVDMRRQADKNEQTIVQVGNRTITDAVETQQKANGYKFTK